MKNIIASCFGSSAVGAAACVAGTAQAQTGTITSMLEIAYLVLGIIGAIGTIAGLCLSIIAKAKKAAEDGKITAEEAADMAQSVEDAANQAADAIEKIGKGKEEGK